MSGKIRCGIIGVGQFTPKRGGVNAIAYAHAEGMKRNSDRFELVAACARTPQSRIDFEREYPCRTYADYRELLAREELDLVVISTFALDREEHVGAAIGAGVRHVLVEKPFALSMETARKLRTMAERRGVRLYVCFQRRYGRLFELARETVVSGQIGQLVHVGVSQPCCNLLDFGPHLVDAALYCSGRGDWRQIAATADWAGEQTWQGLRPEQEMDASVYFGDALRWTITATGRNGADRPAVRLDGTRGFVELRLCPLDGEPGIYRCVTADGNGVECPAMAENFHHGDTDGYLFFERCYGELGRAVVDGAPCRIDLDAVWPTQEMLIGCYAAAERRAPVARGAENPEPEFRLI